MAQLFHNVQLCFHGGGGVPMKKVFYPVRQSSPSRNTRLQKKFIKIILQNTENGLQFKSVQFGSFHFKFHYIQIFKELNNIKHKLQSIDYNINIKLNITAEILENLYEEEFLRRSSLSS